MNRLRKFYEKEKENVKRKRDKIKMKSQKGITDTQKEHTMKFFDNKADVVNRKRCVSYLIMIVYHIYLFML